MKGALENVVDVTVYPVDAVKAFGKVPNLYEVWCYLGGTLGTPFVFLINSGHFCLVTHLVGPNPLHNR